MGAVNTNSSPYICYNISRCYSNGGIEWLKEAGQNVNVVLNYIERKDIDFAMFVNKNNERRHNGRYNSIHI